MDDPGLPAAPGAGEKARRPDAPLTNRVHSFSCRDCAIKSLEVDPGHTLARRTLAPDSHSRDPGEGEGDRRCRLASSPTDRRRGYPTEIRIRGGGPQSTAVDCACHGKFPLAVVQANTPKLLWR